MEKNEKIENDRKEELCKNLKQIENLQKFEKIENLKKLEIHVFRISRLQHSCEPNIFVQNVFVDTHDLRFPWVAFFAYEWVYTSYYSKPRL